MAVKKSPSYTKRQLEEFARTGKPFVSSVVPKGRRAKKSTKRK